MALHSHTHNIIFSALENVIIRNFLPLALPFWKNLVYACMTARHFSIKIFSDEAIKLLRT